ncbi:hypothetical protein LDENG_00213480 [Lucifuga dentata]|nr:hypothetical protein LDENG_00213480 [Lucifuga dentata]
MSRHRSEEEYQKISAVLKIPKSTANSIILKWKKLGNMKTLHRTGHPVCDQEPDTLTEI